MAIYIRLLRTALLLIIFISSRALAQDVPIEQLKRIYFPHPMDRNWQVSLGFTATTMPLEITEEVRYRIPAGDVHLLRRLGKKTYLDTRLNFQVLQNLVTAGPRWAHKLNDRTSLALGNDIGFWFGNINTAGIRTRGSGFQNYPNISLGHRFNKSILVTLRAESIMNFGVNTYAGETKVSSEYSLFSGSAYTVMLEQPFYKKKSLALGFRAIYTSFFWQTWTLFESFDRNILFPQVIVSLIL